MMYLLPWSSYLDNFAVLLGEVERATPKYFIKRKWENCHRGLNLAQWSKANSYSSSALHHKHSTDFSNLQPGGYQIIFHESFIAAAFISTRFLTIPRINIGLKSLLLLIQNLTQSDLNLGLTCRPTTYTQCQDELGPRAHLLPPASCPGSSRKPVFSVLCFTGNNASSYILNLTIRENFR